MGLYVYVHACWCACSYLQLFYMYFATGSCRRKQQFFRDGTSALDETNPCLNCTCSVSTGLHMETGL